jgi:hypothetical protein
VSPRRRTHNQIRQVGMEALNKALGPVDAARFIAMSDPGHGNYTAERLDLIGNPTFEDLEKESAELAKRRNKG